jgi:pyruvate formate lyase activating enzyme
MLEKLINEKLIDYVAMDIKAPLSLMKYKKVVGNNFNDSLLSKLMQSVKILNRRQIDCEFRTTVDDSLSLEDFITIAGEISGKFYIQNVVDKNKISIKKIEKADLEKINTNNSKSLEINLRN